jgi:hypothetical protein
MVLNLSGLPNNAIHVLGFSGEDGSMVKLDVVSQVDAVFSYGWLGLDGEDVCAADVPST